MRPILRCSTVALILALTAGMALRLAYPADIEYKADERWSFETSQAVLDGGPWPMLGMPMSVGGRNPGMSVWVFVALGWTSGADSPPRLARAVQVTNALALLAFVWFAWRVVPAGATREAWLWAAVLWAVNPAAVIFERKIWPPSVLPLLVVGLIAAWWHRRTWIGSFLLAVLAALIGQIHPLSALFPVALVVWGLAADRRSFRWTALVTGGLLGVLPALPWLLTLLDGGPSSEWRTLPLLHFYRRWLLQPFGFSSHHMLGLPHFRAFLEWPLIGAVPTWLVALAHAAAACVMGVLCAGALLRVRSWWRAPRTLLVGTDPSGQLICAALLGYGGLLSLITLTGAGAERHYMIVVAPVMALWVARLATAPDSGRFVPATRTLLAVSCAAQLLISAMLLHYIHHTGIIDAEYGATWAAQQQGLAPPPPAIQMTAEE